MPLATHPSFGDRFDPKIRIDDHDPGWAGMADAEARRIADALGDVAVRIDHVGSTAVPGLGAKPIIDLQVSVRSMEPVAAYAEPLRGLGYLFAPVAEAPDFHFFALPPERPRTHHVHVCEVGSDHEHRHLAVRDFLRAHQPEAAAYEAHKRDVARRHPQDRLAYIEGKEAYVVALERRAVTWARARPPA